MEPAFGLVSTEFSVDLHPSGLRDVSRSIKQIMHAQVLTYSKEYSGVVMGYRDARLLSSTAPVHTFFPYSHVKVAAKLLILKLSENQIIEGTVDQVGADYIGLKVLGGLVAVIHEDELQRKLRYSDTVMGWQSKSGPGEVISAGTIVRFSLKRVDTAQFKFIIVGSTECEDFGVVPMREARTPRPCSMHNSQTNGVSGALEAVSARHPGRHKSKSLVVSPEADTQSGEALGVAEGATKRKKKGKKRKAGDEDDNGNACMDPMHAGDTGAAEQLQSDDVANATGGVSVTAAVDGASVGVESPADKKKKKKKHKKQKHSLEENEKVPEVFENENLPEGCDAPQESALNADVQTGEAHAQEELVAGGELGADVASATGEVHKKKKKKKKKKSPRMSQARDAVDSVGAGVGAIEPENGDMHAVQALGAMSGEEMTTDNKEEEKKRKSVQGEEAMTPTIGVPSGDMPTSEGGSTEIRRKKKKKRKSNQSEDVAGSEYPGEEPSSIPMAEPREDGTINGGEGAVEELPRVVGATATAHGATGTPKKKKKEKKKHRQSREDTPRNSNGQS